MGACRIGRRWRKAGATLAIRCGKVPSRAGGCCAVMSASAAIGWRPRSCRRRRPCRWRSDVELQASRSQSPQHRRQATSDHRPTDRAHGWWDFYVAAKTDAGQPVYDLTSRGGAHILPELGDLVVGKKFTTEELRKWLATMARMPAQRRPKNGKPQYKAAATTEEQIRARRASANRVLSMLKAALNHAFTHDLISSREAWDSKKLKPFKQVDAARLRCLTIEEAQRLINASDPDFRPLVHAAPQTGCRYRGRPGWKCGTSIPTVAHSTFAGRRQARRPAGRRTDVPRRRWHRLEEVRAGRDQYGLPIICWKLTRRTLLRSLWLSPSFTRRIRITEPIFFIN